MILRVVAWSSRYAWKVIVFALFFGIAGELARQRLSRDAIPDLSEPQIVLIANWMGHPASEVFASVTRVLTDALGGIPGATGVRGSSMTGMGYVDVAFASASNLAAGREAIIERVFKVSRAFPAEVHIQVGPVASSTGWVFQYALIDPSRPESVIALRRFQDDVLRPLLAAIPGVAEVAAVGGAGQEVVVELRSEAIRARGLASSDALSVLRTAFAGAGPANVAALEDLPITAPSAHEPTRIGDVARVHVADDAPIGLADLNGFPAVGGIVIARPEADLAALIGHVRRTLNTQRSKLPPGIQLITVYDRLVLADRVEETLFRALREEVAVVVLVILIFLLDVRSALVPLITLPLVLLLTFGIMWVFHVPATIMSLGGIGIALGMAVDADVVALEACHRSLEATAPSSVKHRRAAVVAGAGIFAPAIVTSLLITALSFLPVFAFDGEAGRLLRPLALTKTLVIFAAAVVALTVAPALRVRLLRGRVTREFDNYLTRVLVRLYRPFVQFALERPVVTLATAALALVSLFPIVSRLGGEFLPRLDEGDLLLMPTTLSGVPGDQASIQLARQDRALAAFREVATVFGKVGRANTATDPAPFSMAEVTLRLRPRSQWPKLHRERWYSAWAPPAVRPALHVLWPEETTESTSELVERLDRATRLPGWTNAWTAPARARMDMMSTGVRTPVGIRVLAADSERLQSIGTALRAIVATMTGVRSAVFESLGGETWPAFSLDNDALVRFGVDPGLVRSTVDSILTEGALGAMAVDGLRGRVTSARGMESVGWMDRIREATVRAGDGRVISLSLLGKLTLEARPATIRTEHGQMAAYVFVDLRDSVDVSGFIASAERELARVSAPRDLVLKPGERIEWAGQYGLLAAAHRKLMGIVPIAALSMFGLLFIQFGSVAEALIVLLSVPFALVGSVWTLFFLGYPLSAPVWIGLLSTAGLAMQTGVVMVVYVDEAFYRRVAEGRVRNRDDVVAAHAEGTVRRLRPKIMTLATMAAGLLPLLWADGAGAEIMRRVAAPMIGGLATSAFLTLEVLPVLYTMWRCGQLKRAKRWGVPIEALLNRRQLANRSHV